MSSGYRVLSAMFATDLLLTPNLLRHRSKPTPIEGAILIFFRKIEAVSKATQNPKMGGRVGCRGPRLILS